MEVDRAYREDSMVLETTYRTSSGTVRVVDCLAIEEVPTGDRAAVPDVLLRLVSGIDGRVDMRMVFKPRFDYGNITPWIRSVDGVIEAVGGPDALDLHAGVDVSIDTDSHEAVAEWSVESGEEFSFVAVHHWSHAHPGRDGVAGRCQDLIERTDRHWREWAAICSYDGRWKTLVRRSLLTLKALTYSPTGGIAAAATTSLPERLGGERNWDYRFCWLRDATFMLETLLEHGYRSEAKAWRDWLLRAVAGEPDQLQIMYGLRGERRIDELELDWLSGYEESRPVRVGNGAAKQFQLDVYGEVLDSFHSARRAGVDGGEKGWELQRQLVDFVCEKWREPDEGIWEVRSGPEHFVHSKVMAWAAVDRGISAVERFGLEGPLERWQHTRAAIRAEIMEKGVHAERGCFTRTYDDASMDAALLTLPLVGFIDAKDPTMRRTIETVREELMDDGLLLRYRTDEVSDGLPAGEGHFLLCSFWLVDCLVLLGQRHEAEALFKKLIALRNDVGLLSEQYDPHEKRLLGNFPQVFSHVALVTSAMALETDGAVLGVHRGE